MFEPLGLDGKSIAYKQELNASDLMTLAWYIYVPSRYFCRAMENSSLSKSQHLEEVYKCAKAIVDQFENDVM